MSRKEPTIASILQELAARFEGMVPEREVFDQVLAQRPSRAKDPYASIREQVRFHAAQVGWVWSSGAMVPLRVVLLGLRFRLIPTEEEFAGDLLARYSLRPFMPFSVNHVQFEDVQGQPIVGRAGALPQAQGVFAGMTAPAFGLGDWFKRTRFAPGDSILVTVTQVEPLTLRLEREPAAAFAADAVAPQERALLDELVERVAKGQRTMLVAEDAILPIYARAAWRTDYPGRPWQHLVAEDARLRLLDGDYIVHSSFRRPLDLLWGEERDEALQEASDAALLDKIESLQAELLAGRRAAVERGLWNGIAPRVSTARTIFDMHQGTAETIYLGAVDVLQDHSADIEEHVARGDYVDEGWGDEDDDDFDPLDFDPQFDGDFPDVDDIDDLQTFVDQNPALGEATRKLMASLTPAELERLNSARSLDEVQRVLAPHLTQMLHRTPELFVPLDTPTLASMNGNGHANGNGHINGDGDFLTNQVDLDDEDWEDDALLGDLELDGEDDDEEDEIEVELALERSSELLEAFYQHQIGRGKSDTTATNRTRDVWIYADFLGNYYARSLESGDYATLDECLFFFYPRKVINSSPRAAREICTSVKQFYAYLKDERRVADDAFAAAMWQRREQFARVVELYDQLDAESPQFERLFAHLFAPYTA